MAARLQVYSEAVKGFDAALRYLEWQIFDYLNGIDFGQESFSDFCPIVICAIRPAGMLACSFAGQRDNRGG